MLKSHKITSAELAILQSREGIHVETSDSNPLTDLPADSHPPTAEEWASIASSAYLVDNILFQGPLPDSIDNSQTPWFPPIGVQNHGCNAFSVGYYTKTFQEAKEHGWDLSGASWEGYSSTDYGHPTPSYQDKIMSPAFIYNLNDPTGSIESTIGVACNIGVCTWKTMPYDGNHWTDWPSEEAWIEAAYYRGASNPSYQYIDLTTDVGIANLKNWLASQNLASIYIDANKQTRTNFTPQDFLTLDNYDSTNYNHVNTVVGYDDNIAYIENGVTHYGAFKVANSWGAGIYNWENIPDGFYWISYEAMKQRFKTCLFFNDLIGYEPELTASFRIMHAKRSDCTIHIVLENHNGLSLVKILNDYVSGYPYPYSQNDYLPFPDSSIVVDITEFKDYISIFAPTFWLYVNDEGSSTTGVVTNFAINYSGVFLQCPNVPLPTVNNHMLQLSVTYPDVSPLMALPSSGPAGRQVTINASGLTTGGTASLSYLDTFTNQWSPIINNLQVSSSGTLTYLWTVPDLLKNNPAGDNMAQSDPIIIQVHDNTMGYSFNSSIPYSEMRRGLVRVGNAVATGLYGNNTDLSSTVSVNSGKLMVLAGCWFMPSQLTVLWDNTLVYNGAPVDRYGTFSLTFEMPSATNGTHTLTLTNGDANFCIKVAAVNLPIVPIFTVANNVVYVVSPGLISAFDAKTGALSWENTTSIRVNCTATDNHALYLGSADGLYAMDAVSRATLWSMTSSYYKSIYALDVTDDVLYESTTNGIFLAINSNTGQFIGGDTGSYGCLATGVVIANGKVFLALQDGRLGAYSIPASTIWWEDRFYSLESWSFIAVDGDLLFAASNSKVYAFNANTGSVVWVTDLTEQGGSGSISSLVTEGSQVFASLGTEGYALAADTGSVRFTGTYGTVTFMATSLGVIYMSIGSEVKAINATSSSAVGTILWSYPTGGVVKHLVFTDGLVYSSSTDGNLNAINASNGQKIWSYLNTEPQPTPSPTPSSTPSVSPSSTPTTSPQTTPAPTPTPIIPEYPATVLVLILTIMFLGLTLIAKEKHGRENPSFALYKGRGGRESNKFSKWVVN